MTRQTLDLNRLATVQLVPPTPFSADGSKVRPDLLSRFVEEMSAAGISVFLPAAGTGEFHSLRSDEVIQCVRATRAAGGANAVVLAPVGYSLAHAIAIAIQAADSGADALLLMPPAHPYLCDAGFIDYFDAIADRVALPILAYKKGPVPSDRALAQLGETGRLIGVKYAINDLNEFALFASGPAGKLGLYCGTAERFAPFFMLAGATGYTSGAGNLCPKLTLAMHRALAERKFDEAMRLLQILRPIEDYRRAADSYNISLLKFGLSLVGHNFGPPRPPQRQLNDQEKTEIRQLLPPILEAERGKP